MQNSFESLSLKKPILLALKEQGYSQPTDIQCKAIPPLMAGHDLLATAQTGTGKTAAFTLPIIHFLNEEQRGIRALILTPTRELALQIDTCIRDYSRHTQLISTVVVGGVSINPQIKALRNLPDILVATPGRLLDLLSQNAVSLKLVEKFVLDEADRMLDMGFIRDVRKIVALLPKKRQTMFFSATMSREIAELASNLLINPITVEVKPTASISERITQRVLFVPQKDKPTLLLDVLQAPGVKRAIVFMRTKHRANRISENLAARGITSGAIHSNKSQNARQKALADFEQGRVRVLVATDILSRGIDVDDITHVINFELPNESESYVHRIGRTARAGSAGIAISFCDVDELEYLQGIEKLIKTPLEMDDTHRFHCSQTASIRNIPAKSKNKPGSGGRNSRGGQSRSNQPRKSNNSGNQAGRGSNGRSGNNFRRR